MAPKGSKKAQNDPIPENQKIKMSENKKFYKMKVISL